MRGPSGRVWQPRAIRGLASWREVDLFGRSGERRPVRPQLVRAVAGRRTRLPPERYGGVVGARPTPVPLHRGMPGRAARALHTVFVDDLDEQVERIRVRRLEPASQETYGNGVRKVIYRGPDVTRSASLAPPPASLAHRPRAGRRTAAVPRYRRTAKATNQGLTGSTRASHRTPEPRRSRRLRRPISTSATLVQAGRGRLHGIVARVSLRLSARVVVHRLEHC